MALPWLESLPAFADTTSPNAAFPKRFAVLFMGNGVNEDHWGAEGSGDGMKLSLSLTPLEPLKKKINVVNGLFNKNSTGQGAGNPLIVPAYVFTPKSLRGKAPLIVFVHGGVHGDFESSYAHIVRELIDQGYVIIAPEYRGSTGYGADMYEQIDYGGAEVDDVKAARDWAVENLGSVDAKRVGIIGWSHGGYQTLMNIFRWPEAYQVAYAGVPVSDLVQRMGYKSQGYRNTFKEFIGKEAVDDPMEYRRRSPYFWADKLATPLLVHTNTNDEDVNVMEVQHLIDSLKAAGKKFEYKIYENAPGGHRFNRIDTALAKQSRQEVWAFLAKYLK